MKSVIVLFISSLMLSCSSIAQTTESKTVFVKETSALFKCGTTVNFINNRLYKNFNNGFTAEQCTPVNTSWFINPYVSIGIENHFKKHAVFQFSLGFYQTLQKYTYTYNFITVANLANTGTGVPATAQYVNNNIFLELMPGYIYNRTRLMVGINGTLSNPTVISTIDYIDPNSGTNYKTQVRDRPKENYHLYLIVGAQQGIPIGRHELMISLSYFGLLKKYDSGINATLGFLF